MDEKCAASRARNARAGTADKWRGTRREVARAGARRQPLAPNDTQQLQPMADQGIANVGVPDGVTADSGHFSEANVQSVEQLPPLLVARRGEREGRVPASLRGPQSRQAVADRGGRGAPDAVTATRPLRDDFADSSSP